MKIIYRTIDGIEFNNESDAIWHEEEVLGKNVKMYDPYGKRVLDPNDAVAVFLCSGVAADYFIEICHAADTNANGINPGDEGPFVWDSIPASYIFIESEAIRAIHGATADALAAGYAD
jgi:hypothetical protein